MSGIGLKFTSTTETSQSFLRKFDEMGGIVEELVTAMHVRSPSVQMRIAPDGEPMLVSSHEALDERSQIGVEVSIAN